MLGETVGFPVGWGFKWLCYGSNIKVLEYFLKFVVRRGGGKIETF